MRRIGIRISIRMELLQQTLPNTQGNGLITFGRIRIQPAGLDTFHTNSGRLRLSCYYTRMVGMAELANKTARAHCLEDDGDRGTYTAKSALAN